MILNACLHESSWNDINQKSKIVEQKSVVSSFCQHWNQNNRSFKEGSTKCTYKPKINKPAFYKKLYPNVW